VVAQTYSNLEVLILDDNSKEPLCDKITHEFGDKRIRCVRSETTLGVAGGRNRLIEEAKGKFLVTLDDDTILRDDYALSKLVELFDSYPDVGIFAFKIIDIADGSEIAIRIPFRKSSVRRNPELANLPQYVSYFLGGGHAARRDVYEKCGLYPEDLVFGVEELDLSYRMIEAGYKMSYTPDIVVEHYSKYSSSLSTQARAKYMYFLARNKIWVNYKYLPWFAFLINSVTWSLIRLFCSIFTGGFVQIIRGISDGFKGLRRLKRTPISKKTIEYLRDNHGRLFF
jgi:GT2 family glycosyltransferase